jgi:mannosyltransferase
VATLALPRPGAFRARSVVGTRLLEAVGVLALIGISLLLRSDQLGTHFWIDEGLSVGIADRPLLDIPGVLVQDGSPPLYYMLLHVWMGIAGDGEAATHWLSLIFAILCIPAGLWVGSSLFDRRTGWTLAVLAALCPFLTTYAQETRMYALVAFLGLLATGFFVHAYVRGHRGYRIPFGVTLALLLYTHNWALFLGAAYAIGVAIVWTAAPKGGVERRRLLRDALLGFGVAAVLYLPWVPTLVSQTLHTGAPWSNAPSFHALIHAPDQVFGGFDGTVALLLAAGAGVVAVARSGRFERRVLVPVLLVLAVAPILIPWLTSQISPAWAVRYLAAAVGPLLLLAAVGLRRAGGIGIAGLALIALMWVSFGAPSAKSNVYLLGEELGPDLRRGDLVVSTQPELVPVLSHYLPRDDDLTFATPLGVTEDTGVTDWRDGIERFDASDVGQELLPLLDRVPEGGQVLLVTPIITSEARWSAPWTSRVYDRTLEYEGVLRGDPRFELVATLPDQVRSLPPNPVQGLLFRKVG